MELPIREIAHVSQKRSARGRVVLPPPEVTPRPKATTTGSFFMCCNRAFLTKESFERHQGEKEVHGKAIDPSKFPKSKPEVKRPILGPSSPKFWRYRKTGIPNKVFEPNVDDEDDDLNDENETSSCKESLNVPQKEWRKGRIWKRCDICFLSTDKMPRHLKTCHSDSPYKCDYCPCTLKSIAAKSVHEVKMHGVFKPNGITKKATLKVKQNKVAHVKPPTISKPEVEKMLENLKDTKCLMCGKELTTKLGLREHIYSHYGTRPYKCEICGMGFNFISNLNRHRKTAHLPGGGGNFSCGICKSRFNSSKRLQFHTMAVHSKKLVNRTKDNLSNQPTKPHNQSQKVPLSNLSLPSRNNKGLYECHICKKQLSCPQSWRGHMRIHQNLKPYKCKFCGVNFRLHSTMTSHIQNAHSGGSHKCSQCCCQYNSEHALLLHVRSYHRSNKIGTTANTNANLKRPSPAKSEVKKSSKPIEDSVAGYRCNLCGVMVKSLEEFNNHKLLHSNAKNGQCNLCLKEISSGRVKKHKKLAHGNGTYKCPFCCCQYATSRPLFNHLTLQHEMRRDEWNFKDRCITTEARKRIQYKSYESDIKETESSETSERQQSAAAGLPRKRKTCNLCNLEVRDLLMHQKKSHFHNGTFQCTLCSCKFTLRKGLSAHVSSLHGIVKSRNIGSSDVSKAVEDNVQVVSYMCTYCEKTFNDNSDYREHVKLHTNEKKFECELCHLKFGSKGTVRSHKRVSHHHNGSFKCLKCCCKFLTSGGLANHYKLHNKSSRLGTKDYASALVKSIKMRVGSNKLGSSGPRFTIKRKFVSTAVVSSIAETKCPKCFKTLSSHKALLSHMDVHKRREIGEKQFQCDLCELKFLHPDSIRLHIKRCHDPNSNFKCSRCSCQFTTKLGLMCHEGRYHGSETQQIGEQKKDRPSLSINSSASGEDEAKTNDTFESNTNVSGESTEPKRCDICHLEINAATSIRQHKRNCHLHDGQFQCLHCSCKFKTLNGLSKHKNKYHSQPGKNNSAPHLTIKANNNPSANLKAQKFISGTCHLCGCRFVRKGSIKKHIKVAHSNGPLKCKYCCCCFHHHAGLRLHESFHENGPKVSKLNGGKRSKLKTNSSTKNGLKRSTSGSVGPIKSFNANFLKIRGPSPSKMSPIRNQSSEISAENVKQQKFDSSSPTKALSPKKYKYKCDLCGIKFYAIMYLNRHLEKAHIPGGIQCDMCPCTFINNGVLAAHRRVYHNALVERVLGKFSSVSDKSASINSTPEKPKVDCNKPTESSPRQGTARTRAIAEAAASSPENKASTSQSNIETQDHNNEFSFSCNWCDKKFSNEKVLGQHILSHTRPEPCPKCNLRFRTKAEVAGHMRSHHGSGQFKCSVCSCQFTSQVGLKQHCAILHKGSAVALLENQLSSNTDNDFVIENEQGDEDLDNNEDFIQVDSTYSDYIHTDENESEPIIESYVGAGYEYQSNVVSEGNNTYVDEEEIDENAEEAVTSTSSFPLPKIKNVRRVIQEEEQDMYPIIINCHSISNQDQCQPQPSSSTSLDGPLEPPPKKRKFSPKSRPMKCGTCGITCLGPEKLNEHMETHVLQDQAVPNIVSSPNLEKELEIRKDDDDVIVLQNEALKCNECPWVCPNKVELAEHMQMEHDEAGLYQCAYCTCSMKTESNLRNHFMKCHDIVI